MKRLFLAILVMGILVAVVPATPVAEATGPRVDVALVEPPGGWREGVVIMFHNRTSRPVYAKGTFVLQGPFSFSGEIRLPADPFKFVGPGETLEDFIPWPKGPLEEPGRYHIRLTVTVRQKGCGNYIEKVTSTTTFEILPLPTPTPTPRPPTPTPTPRPPTPTPTPRPPTPTPTPPPPPKVTYPGWLVCKGGKVTVTSGDPEIRFSCQNIGMGSGRDSEVRDVRVEIYNWPRQFSYLGAWVQRDAEPERISGELVDESIAIDRVGTIGQGSRFWGGVIFDIPQRPEVEGVHKISGKALFRAIDPETRRWNLHGADFVLTVEVELGTRRELNPDGTYTVQSGDTLWAIARWLQGLGVETSIEELAAANGITDPNFILVGQVLVVPN